ncbi:MAG: exosortase A [Rhodospirillaceae bacterium]
MIESSGTETSGIETRAPLVVARPALSANAWTLAAAVVVLLLAIYADTAATAVALWSHASAYSYAFLIAPISAFLIWRERGSLAGLFPEPAWTGLAVVAAFAVVWLAADFLWIAEGRHIALMGMIQGLLLAILGFRIYRLLAFPLLYLWLMVPTGTFLIAPLQHISHAGALALIKLSGIPVFADGMLIEVPEGRFVVEPGCAGLNFILAALALSLLYAKLNYRSARARMACVALALATSIVANIVRIYLIIVLTQVTHRQLDIADDHLLYGWGFFGAIMLAMMWWGGRFATADLVSRPVTPGASAAPPMRVAAIAAAALVIAAMPAALSAATAPAAVAEPKYTLPEAVGPWRKTAESSEDWTLAAGPDTAIGHGAYTWNRWRADVAVAAYAVQVAGHEAAAGDNLPAAKPWDVTSTEDRVIPANQNTYHVAAATLRKGESARAVIYWYRSGDCITASRLRARACAALARLQGRPAPGAFVAVSAERPADGAELQSILTEFARALLLTNVGISKPE